MRKYLRNMKKMLNLYSEKGVPPYGESTAHLGILERLERGQNVAFPVF